MSPVPPVQQSGNVSEIDGVGSHSNDVNANYRKMTQRRNSLHSKLSPGTGRRLHVLHDNSNCGGRSPTVSIDTRLNDWLTKHNIDVTSKNIILSELFTYEDFVYELEKTDLHRIGLKWVARKAIVLTVWHQIEFQMLSCRCGVEVKLWRAIKNHRKQHKTLTEELAFLNMNKDDLINRNSYQCPMIVCESPSPQLHHSGSGSNCNSFDSNSNHTASSEDYESCNGSNFDDRIEVWSHAERVAPKANAICVMWYLTIKSWQNVPSMEGRISLQLDTFRPSPPSNSSQRDPPTHSRRFE